MRKSHTPKRWHILPGDDEAESVLQDELGIHAIVARLLVQRGITTPDAAYTFLNPSFDHLHDPFLLLLGDHVYISDIKDRCARQLLNVYEKNTLDAVSAVQPTLERLLHLFGVIQGEPIDPQRGIYKVKLIVEKPAEIGGPIVQKKFCQRMTQCPS